MNEAFNRRDFDAMLALMDDDVEIVPRLGAMEGDYRGHEGVRRWWGDLLGVFPDYAAEVEELHDLGDVTVAQIRGQARGGASGAPVVETWWQAIRWRDGMCIWWRNGMTKADALEGVSRVSRSESD